MTEKKLHVAWGPYCGPDTDCLSEEEQLDQFRVEFFRGPGVQVTGWPAKGGVYILERCLGVELDFLGLDRFHNTPRPSGPDAAAEEEAHCNKMRQLGATWWRSEHAYDMAYFTSPKGEDGRFLRVGWETGGGVWVLSTTKQGADQKGTAIIQNAYTMEERCKAIEKLGGVFYANPVDCPELDLSDV
ncbi:hypothetical protein M441DRAFT_143413 [Trichoderma asperellum CBS 433.97]|uniref:Uncharacterized protein n=1 Tax=Trichoderma asperellum (strain ATCC 204424 / CBS 433.97 / NBRC 101777) TaxID=1042311 RepID=A0A2T3Z3W8_TRIA4|nr:hypothetical protein M441DRAFT_143413 [Trichoderma asperellum CBS 433.97]PTB39492.1 hypothetical protein M441DRAFT_143413 [Trichoderma asperellum CBS 433.97]